jgi:hypothetical protein
VKKKSIYRYGKILHMDVMVSDSSFKVTAIIVGKSGVPRVPLMY